jgi:AcrR family transcriptional regulator
MILQGAALVFARQGARLPSVEDILEAAGVSRRTFYRFYQSKEDVLLALYQLGTEGLLQACRLAASEESEPARRFERCIDAHLLNARGLGRLIFVLGGEAQRHESPLHARRMEVHDALVDLLTDRSASPGAKLDPLLVRSLILALEGVVRFTLQGGDEGRDVSEASLAHARRVMLKLCRAAYE